MNALSATPKPVDPERRRLQIAVCLACVAPLSAGLAGMLSGARFVSPIPDLDLDSHARYLSGLLFGLGLIFLSCVPRIEETGDRFRLAAFPVVIGGLARLFGVMIDGRPSLPMSLALVMELVVTPGLALWQARVARRG